MSQKKFVNRARRDRIYLVAHLVLLIPILSGRTPKESVAWTEFQHLAGICKGQKACFVALSKAFPICFAENVVWNGSGWSQGVKNIECVEQKSGFRFREDEQP